jgi:hypothetical protein
MDAPLAAVAMMAAAPQSSRSAAAGSVATLSM